MSDYKKFITGTHELYQRYIDDWRLAVRSYWGGVEYREAKYLKRYQIDDATPSEVIRTYDIDDDGVVTGRYSSVAVSDSRSQNESGDQYLSNFYMEKLHNVPLFPYTRLYVSEYNSILFRNPPVRNLPDTPDINEFINDCDGEGNSINEFVSMVDVYTTVYGIVWTSCIKPADSNYARWRMFSPIDVPNWKYMYNSSGDLELAKIVLRIGTDSQMDIYQHITKESIDIVFVPKVDDFDVDLPEEAEFFEGEGDDDLGYYVIRNENELGYIPIEPVYQSNKIYNGIGHTPIFDIAQIQRSIYGDSAEIYSSISYGAHPVNIVDEDTAKINDGALGAEPGTIVRVPASVNGTPNYVFEFRAPPLDSIKELRELIDQKIDKMNHVAMIRTEDLIRASRSGAQIEQYDSKLEAFIRKKATALENWEVKMWNIWYDWLNKPMPEDQTISYNRLYSSRGLSAEIGEVKDLMSLLVEYETQFVKEEPEEPEMAAVELPRIEGRTYPDGAPIPATLPELYQSASNDAVPQGQNCANCEYFMAGQCAKFAAPVRDTYWCAKWESEMEMESGEYDEAGAIEVEGPENDHEFIEEMKEKIKTRMKQLIDSSFSENSL